MTRINLQSQPPLIQPVGNNLPTSLLKQVNLFSTLSLDELGEASLLDRQETKYLLPEGRLSIFLPSLESEYRILEIQGRSTFDYCSVYLDTPERLFYYQHHAGVLPRWKIRQRIYLNSGLMYFEIKKKDNRGFTHKTRQRISDPSRPFSSREVQLLESRLPGIVANLEPVLETRYSRVTLVHKEKGERITMDRQLRFSNGTGTRSLPYLAVIEIKQARTNHRSPCRMQLKQNGARPTSFSKYCLGSLLLTPGIKHNRFKPTLHLINALLNGGNSYEWTH